MSVFKRGGSDYWYAFRWTLRYPDGHSESFRIQRSAKTHNKQVATDAMNEHRRALRLGEVHPSEPWPKPALPKPAVSTLRTFSSEFLAHAGLHTKAGTVRFYRTKITNLLSSPFADIELSGVNTEVIEKYAKWRQDQVATTTLNGDLRCLRALLNYAEEIGRINKAPATRELPGAEGRDRVLSFAEELKYLSAATRTLHDAALLMIDGGICPQSELFVFEWPNIHFEADAENPHGFVHIAAGKTKHRVRNVPLTARCRRMLEERRTLTGDSRWLFPSKQSATGHLTTLQHPHEDACRAAGIEGFTIYGFRHTFGTRCAQSGMDKFSVARLMGHSNPSVAERYYVHVVPTHVSRGFREFSQYLDQQRIAAVPEATDRVQ